MIINNLIETHSHILPGIDDGSKNVEMSLDMISALERQGATKIIATPHYYSDSISLSDFIAKRNASFNKLSDSLSDSAPKILAGAEVYITKYLFSNDDLSPICIGNTRYALIEHSFAEEFEEKAFNRLLCLIEDHSITPILAHIERYKALMEHPKRLDILLDAGCLTQVNVSSFASSRRSVKKKLFKFLESGRITLIGSDCHNTDTRLPEYSDGVKEIISKYGQSAIDTLVENANRMFGE